VLRPLLWITLGAWIGAMGFFGAVVAPAAFRVLPAPTLAGDLIGRVLGGLHVAGSVAGIALAALGAALRRGRLTVVLPLALTAVCLVNWIGVSPAVAELRPGSARFEAEPGAGPRFALLHALSVALYVATVVGLFLLALVHARAEAREARQPGP
jgi:hypothetical protein